MYVCHIYVCLYVCLLQLYLYLDWGQPGDVTGGGGDAPLPVKPQTTVLLTGTMHSVPVQWLSLRWGCPRPSQQKFTEQTERRAICHSFHLSLLHLLSYPPTYPSITHLSIT